MDLLWWFLRDKHNQNVLGCLGCPRAECGGFAISCNDSTITRWATGSSDCSTSVMTRHLPFVLASVTCFLALNASADAQQVKADTGGIAISGSVSSSTISTGIPQEKVDALVRDARRPLEELSAEQRENIALLKEKLDLNERQVRAALGILGENDIAPERLGAKLVEIAEGFKALKAATALASHTRGASPTASAQPGDNPKITALRADAQKAIEAAELAKADALLANVEAEQRRDPNRLAADADETSARRGEIALTRLRYAEAAKHFANAAVMFPPNSAYENKRIDYLTRAASALYHQGSEFGDNNALRAAIEQFVHDLHARRAEGANQAL